MAILEHSGVGPNDYQLRVGNGEKTVEFTYFWPMAMADTLVLHRFWEGWLRVGNNEDVHSRSIGFDVFLKLMRKSITERIESTVTSRLPFKVNDFIDNSHFLGWRYIATIVVYFDLRAIEDKSYEKIREVRGCLWGIFEKTYLYSQKKFRCPTNISEYCTKKLFGS